MEYGKKFQKSPVNQDITQTTTSVSLNLKLVRTFIITLQSNLSSITVSNIIKGADYDFVFIQDATGGRTVTFPSELQFVGNLDLSPDAVTVYSGKAYSTSSVKGGAGGVSTTPVITTSVIYLDIVNGSDTTGDGSINNPYQNLPKGIDSVDDGGTVYLFPGSYFDNRWSIPKNISFVGLIIENPLGVGSVQIVGTVTGYVVDCTTANKEVNFTNLTIGVPITTGGSNLSTLNFLNVIGASASISIIGSYLSFNNCFFPTLNSLQYSTRLYTVSSTLSPYIGMNSIIAGIGAIAYVYNSSVYFNGGSDSWTGQGTINIHFTYIDGGIALTTGVSSTINKTSCRFTGNTIADSVVVLNQMTDAELVTAINTQLGQTTWQGSSNSPTFLDKNTTASVTSGNGSDSGASLSANPIGDVQVRLSGWYYPTIGDAVKTKETYWSRDGGTTALSINSLQQGDVLYWNGTIKGEELAVTDLIDLIYNTL